MQMSENQHTLAFVEPEKGNTPLMRQYFRIKGQHPDAILLFRMGDFYETFAEDAVKVAPVLGITLTKRANGKAANVELAGFPHHALDAYLPKLVRAGFRVAICEQIEDPKTTSKLVKRDVVEVVTPGVILRDQLLDPKRSHFLASVVESSSGQVGISFLDVSTGEFALTKVPPSDVKDFLYSINPSEIIVPKSDDLLSRFPAVTTRLDDWAYSIDFAQETLLQHFGTHSLKGFGIDGPMEGISAAGAILHYVKESQPGALRQIRKLTRVTDASYMWLDSQTRRNLELIDANNSHGEGSLISLLDRTQTAMGARLLRTWVVRPLRDLSAIQERHDAVENLVRDPAVRSNLGNILSEVGDLERLAGKVASLRANPRDLDVLRRSLQSLPQLQLLEFEDSGLATSAAQIDTCDDVVELIQMRLQEDPPVGVNSGGIILESVSEELDDLRQIASSGKTWIAEMQHAEAQRTGISSLKIGYNRVFGYYIEITNTHKDKVPEDYIRKQTLVNAERYITPELKEQEEKVLSAQERIGALEKELFEELRADVAAHIDKIFDSARCVAELDCYRSLAEVAEARQYRRPSMSTDNRIEIVDGRHPVVEALLPEGDRFIPNSVTIDTDTEQILVITGPNMAGKSVYLRQTGLIVLLAQIGSFVPAESAQIGIVDRIFTRVGASDNVAHGESTFLVEMNETANILNNATAESLILLDEVGRGTSTFDGLSIAWALVEYLHETPAVQAKTLFATHYHELNELADSYERIRNRRVLVKEHDGKVIFMRRVVAGGADHSYGIEVARMAGLPNKLINRAAAVLALLEGNPVQVQSSAAETAYADVGNDVDQAWIKDLKSLDLDSLTPIQALVKLHELKSKALK